VNLLENYERLQPRREQWDSPQVQAFLKSLKIEAEAIHQLGLVVTKASCERNQYYARKLEELGLEPPETPADTLQIYVALRAVLNFVSRNLDRLKADSETVVELEKQLAREANDSLGR
jgi:hypothetical protein